MDLILRVALTHLRHRKRQTLVSVFGVAMGVGFFIGMAALMQGFQSYFVSKIIDVWPHIIMKDEFRNPALQPASRRYPEGAVQIHSVKPLEELRGIRDGKSVVAALNQMEGVHAAPTLRTQAFMRFGAKDVSCALVGIDAARERDVSHLERDMIAGKLAALHTTANGVILGEGLAAKLGAQMGNTLSVISPAGVIVRMEVAGIFRTGITTIDNFEAYSLIKDAQILANRPNVINQIRIRLTNVEWARDIARGIETRYGYRTESWEETYENVLGIFVIQNGIMYSTVGAILIVAAFGIFNIISTIIHEKTRDIAILRSIGLEEGDIRVIFLLEGLIVGVVGTLLGWALGHGIVELLGTIRFNVEGFVRTEGFILNEHAGQYLLSATFALLSSSLAAFLPARKAAKLKPVDIIRGAG